MSPPEKAIQGSKPANNHNPKVKLFSGRLVRVNLTLRTMANT
jgi:hypothetical protein